MQGKWRENLIKIKPYVAGEQSNDKDMIKLNANENPYPPSPQVKKVFEKYAQNSDGLKKYPNSDLDWFYEEEGMQFAGHYYSGKNGEVIDKECPVSNYETEEDDMEF